MWVLFKCNYFSNERAERATFRLLRCEKVYVLLTANFIDGRDVSGHESDRWRIDGFIGRCARVLERD